MNKKLIDVHKNVWAALESRVNASSVATAASDQASQQAVATMSANPCGLLADWMLNQSPYPPGSDIPMCVCTVDDANWQDGHPTSHAHAEPAGLQPAARMVLWRGWDPDNGDFTFYTNYESRKGCGLQSHPRTALLLFWGDTEAQWRQIRVEGRAEIIEARLSDDYFVQRSRLSQLGAHLSQQSRWSPQPIQERMERAQVEAKGADGSMIKRPAHWGGFRVRPDRWEFWESGQGRLHRRRIFQRSLNEEGQTRAASSTVPTWHTYEIDP